LGSVVITTVQAPTDSVKAMLTKARGAGFDLIAIGDRKTPDVVWPEGARYFSVKQQNESDLEYARAAPLNHYARKNIGYLIAMAERAPVIFDTDDDNAPLESWGRRTSETRARRCPQAGWVNVYQWFSNAHVWPRGFPLDRARHQPVVPDLGVSMDVLAPIQQGLADGSPDVDAVWRLLMDQDIRFHAGDSVYLPEGAWCPFNSQSTWWFPVAYPLMYLPSFVSFRMTDIWRSFIAQRCLWALGHGLVFHGPEVFQDRNPHHLMRDFEQEVPGYLGNDKIRSALEQTHLSPETDAAADNCYRCYEALVRTGFVPTQEMAVLEAWLRDVERLVQRRNLLPSPH
jgi:STELLO glycosyltransferases